MRILRLDLLAFGPFTGQTLPLDHPHASLHLVYGPNEAGKSSSLRALRQWLYGIPHNSGDNFVHANQSLRIGGVLQDGQGRQLECIRRKGRDKTLRAADDVETIAPEILAQMLGGVDEISFCQRFGIGYEELRRGGQAIVEGGGELGAALFAAGAGLADIRLVQAKIEAELQELFKPNGSNPRINKALAELKAIRIQIKDAQLSTAQWVEHDKALQAARQQQAALDAKLLEAKSQRSRLERLHKALPSIADRKRLAARLASLGDAPLLPADFTAQRRETLTSLASSQQAEQEATEDVEKLQKAIAKMAIPVHLLERRSAITNLYAELGSYRKAAKDRPALVAQHGQLKKQASELLGELGRQAELLDSAELRLTRGERQRIQDLVVECQVRLEKQASAAATERKLARDVDREQQAASQLAPARNVDRLRQAVRRTQKHGNIEQQLVETNAALKQLEVEAAIDLKRLSLFHGTREELEQLPVCPPETIDRIDSELLAANAEAAKQQERVEEMAQEIRRLEGQLDLLHLEHNVPTEVDLEEARRLRDHGWQLIRDAWEKGSLTTDAEAAQFVARFAPGGDLAQAYQESVRKSDHVSDRLRREADRVADKAKLTADLRQLTQRRERAESTLDQSRIEVERLQAQWRELWTPLGIEPLTPREMQSWRRQQQSLREQTQAIRAQAHRVNALSSDLQALRDALAESLQQIDQPAQDAFETLAELVEYCERVVDAEEIASRQRREREQKLDALRNQLDDAREQAAQAAADLQRWREDWTSAVAPLGLTGDAPTSDAIAAMQAVDEILAQLKEATSLLERVEGIDRDALEFKQSVQRLLEDVASDLVPLPVEQAVANLYDRLAAAAKLQTQVDEWNEQLQGAASRRDKAAAAASRLEALVDSLCEQAGCASVDELADAEQRSMERRAYEQELATIDQQLRELAGNELPEEFSAQAEALESEQVMDELQQLARLIDEIEQARTHAAEAIGSHRNELARMDGNSRAAAAQDQAEHLLASLRSDAEHYIRLRLAAAVLRRSIERFRQASQGPVLRRAGELFAEMTLGSFCGLRADYDDDGKATLVGVRTSSRELVSVDQMSDGTCDQLYLALRLALLEAHLNDHEPMPFIVDDILIQFDDSRAAASLKVLAQFSQKTQVIFFTHHERLIELAREQIEESRLVIHRLDSASARAVP